MKRLILLFWMVLFPAFAYAQSAAEISQQTEDDRGFLTRFLESKLSGAGRQVVISGFRGALSSRATFDEIAISDAEGQWLVLKNGAIQWTRSALLTGRIEINELSAAEILIPRKPETGEEGRKLEVQTFSLPELPVGIRIDQLRADRVELGEAWIGQPVALSAQGKMQLAGGEGNADLTIERLDAARGSFVLDAAYSNSTTVLNLDLTLDEGQGGLLSTMLDLPGHPSVEAHIKGGGPLSDWASDISLGTNGQPRVTGMASIKAEANAAGEPGRSFRLQIGGDMAALVREAQRDFFGSQAELRAEGWRGDDGAISVPVLQVRTEAMQVAGRAEVNASGAPTLAALQIDLGRDAGADNLPVRLPFAPAGAMVESGQLRLSYDVAQSDGWTLNGQLGQILTEGGSRIESLLLSGGGQVRMNGTEIEGLGGPVGFQALGIALADAGQAQAVGPFLSGSFDLDWTSGNAVELTDLQVEGEDYGVDGEIRADGLNSGMTVTADLDAHYTDLARLSELAGRKMSGRADANLRGFSTLLSGAFDGTLTVTGTDISVDQKYLDRLLRGQSNIIIDAGRHEDGTELRELSIRAQRLNGRAYGTLRQDSSNLQAVFSVPSLSDLDPDMSGNLRAEAALTGPSGLRRVTLSAEANDLRTGQPDLDGALNGRTMLTGIVQETEGVYKLETLRLANDQLVLNGTGDFTEGAMDAQLDFDLADLGRIRAAAGGSLKGQAQLRDQGGSRHLTASAEGLNLRLGGVPDGALSGPSRLALDVEQAANGRLTVNRFDLSSDQTNATAQGVLARDGGSNLTASLRMNTLASIGLGWQGSVQADGQVTDNGEGAQVVSVSGVARDLSMGQGQVDAALAGATNFALLGVFRDGVLQIEEATVENPRLNAQAEGRVGAGATDVTARLRAANLAFLGHGLGGSVEASGRLRDDGNSRRIEAQGNASGLRVGNAQADAILAGTTRFDLAAQQVGDRFSVSRLMAQNNQFQINASGDPMADIQLDARLSDLGLVVTGFPGPAQVTGTVRQEARNFVLDLTGQGPGGTRVQASGTMARDGSDSDLRISGTGDAAAANPMLRVRSVEGPVDFDLRMQGRPGLEALTGQVRLPNARIADPAAGVRIENIALTADLDRGRIVLDGTGNFAAGGRVSVSGPVDLRGDREMDLVVTLDNVHLRDPELYETIANGQVRITGPEARGALISGRVHLEDTEVRIPNSSFGAKKIPEIRHIADSAAVEATRAKAGLTPWPSPASRQAGMSGPAATPSDRPMRLDLLIDAPNRVFVRGRGVDAELGGQLRLSGNVRAVIPIGHLELIRGRVDLLGKRFDLTEGLIELQGSMIPVLRLVAQTEQNGILTEIIIDGEAMDPDITFQSSPDMPQEEVLSHLLFGRGLDNISALQAAQLANAVAVLAGQGGIGVVGALREQTGLDDLDLTTDEDGSVGVRAGKYLSDNVYTDVQLDDTGRTKLNLNLDISDSLTVRGSVSSDGGSSIGLFYERDY
ncbi:MAG: translocation/assembly module TamB domain-containing protein [Paracoccus sp. (in: a-proteobacteria)]|uniref:translocation/assembly module TamB domain-containing protein n=1 Tax=Paracoccus sp. TaxID=267 RepID=UPI0026E06159|nr:translocation/assembly module TamB domain-containing protein [Paracoccus sp. (in: a-proteobacteria)]MDO5621003.1 translocation/assembly module TamB domain-containing protein [Paracoccus sp. (in: a-proteobacteria)]